MKCKTWDVIITILLFLTVTTITFLSLCGATYLLRESDNKQMAAKIDEQELIILRLREVHEWMPVIEQALPQMSQDETRVLREKLRQDHKKKERRQAG